MSVHSCISVIDNLSEDDQKAVLDRLEQYQAKGIPAEKAQRMAVADVLGEARQEHEAMVERAKAAYPEAFTEASPVEQVAPATEPAPAEAKASPERNPVVDTPAFKKWFGDSKVVDENGDPVVLYHGTTKSFDSFDPGRGGEKDHGWYGVGSYLTADPDTASAYSVYDEMKDGSPTTGANVLPVYASLQNPYVWPKDRQPTKTREEAIALTKDLIQRGYDGVVVPNEYQSPEYAKFHEVVVFKPEQIKSATGNNGNFNPTNPDIRESPARSPREAFDAAINSGVDHQFKSEILNNLKNGLLSAAMPRLESELNIWGKTIGTPFHKAQMNKAYARVFNAVQRFIEDSAAFSIRAEQLARTIFPEANISPFKNWSAGLSTEENTQLGTILADGTLHEGVNPTTGQEWTDAELLDTKRKQDGSVAVNRKTGQEWTADEVRAELRANPHVGKIFTDEELRTQYGAGDKVIAAYHEAREAIGQSLSDYAKSQMADLARTLTTGLSDQHKQAISAVLTTLVKSDESLPDAVAAFTQTATAIGQVSGKDPAKVIASMKAVASTTQDLIRAGYSPLTRYGEWAVQGLNEKGEQVFFTMAASKAEAQQIANKLKKDPAIATVPPVSQMDPQVLSVFSGLSPETAALFAEHAGVENSEVMQDFLRLAVSNRSVLQRMQKRQGTEGYSVDATRTLASFITGNARKTSSNLHNAEMMGAVVAKDLHGDYKADAEKLVNYVRNPVEEAQRLRGFLFANYLGGSIASGLVNLTQPVLMTFPYLSQFGVKNAGVTIKQAMVDAGKFMRGKQLPEDITNALNIAKEMGILDPNEMFQLMAAAQQGAGSFTMQKFMRVWGANFQLSEQFNRATTFIAAYRTAEQAMKTEDGKAQIAQAMGVEASSMISPVEFAAHAISETQGVYNKGNRPNWARGALGSTVFTFKQFSISYLEFLRRMYGDGLIPKKQFAVALTTLALASGLNGLPLADDLDDILDTIGHLLGYSTNSKKWKKQMLSNVVGKDFADALTDGVSHYLPFDLSGRLGAGNFLPATKIFDPAQTAQQKMRSVLELGGVAGSTVANYVDAVGQLAKGDMRSMLYTAAPVAVQNIGKGAEMLVTGEARDMAGRKITDASPMDAFFKTIGLQPEDVANQRQANSIVQQDINTRTWMQTSVNREYARAMANGDRASMDDVRERVREWNQNNPQARIQLNMSSIAQQVREMRMDANQRAIKNAPATMRAGVREELSP